jgi:hypothetical protein
MYCYAVRFWLSKLQMFINENLQVLRGVFCGLRRAAHMWDQANLVPHRNFASANISYLQNNLHRFVLLLSYFLLLSLPCSALYIYVSLSARSLSPISTVNSLQASWPDALRGTRCLHLHLCHHAFHKYQCKYFIVRFTMLIDPSERLASINNDAIHFCHICRLSIALEVFILPFALAVDYLCAEYDRECLLSIPKHFFSSTYYW